LKYQRGSTRKMLILTCGFTILLATTYYQSNLLQQLMIPKRPPKGTLRDIANTVASHQSKVILYAPNSLIEVEIMSSKSEEMALLANAMRNNKTIYENNEKVIMEKINLESAIVIEEVSIIHDRLSKLRSEECANYVIMELAEIIPPWMSIVLRKDETRTLEALNAIVAERYSASDDIYDMVKLTEECKNHIFPSGFPSPTYRPLSLYTLSGSFVLIFTLLLLSLLVCLIENIVSLFKHDNITPSTGATLDFSIPVAVLDQLPSEQREHILYTYHELIALVPISHQ
jgi:hypothetical protein